MSDSEKSKQFVAYAAIFPTGSEGLLYHQGVVRQPVKSIAFLLKADYLLLDSSVCFSSVGVHVFGGVS